MTDEEKDILFREIMLCYLKFNKKYGFGTIIKFGLNNAQKIINDKKERK